MAVKIRHAAASKDWRQVATLDREIGALMPQLARMHALAAADLEALALLRRAHAEARQECALALERIDAHLAEHRERKGGWMAYALNDPEGRA